MELVYKSQQYERIGTLSLDEVFNHIKNNFYNKGKKGKVDISGFNVNVQSLRLRTFYHTGIECPCCPTVASFFAVERNSSEGGYHLNLYGLDEKNNEVLFTHDHILARSLGGKDELDNTQTMCGPCNWSKGKLENLLGQALNLNDVERANEIHIKLNKYQSKKTISKKI